MNKTWTVIISVLVTALVVGASVYYYTTTLADAQKTDLESQISQLEQQVETLSTESSDQNEVTKETEKKTDAPEGWTSYENEVYGVNFNYPSNWGVAKSGGPIAFTSPDVKNGHEGLESGNMIFFGFELNIDNQNFKDFYIEHFFGPDASQEVRDDFEYEVKTVNGEKAYQTEFGRLRMGPAQLDTCFEKTTDYVTYSSLFQDRSAYYCLTLQNSSSATESEMEVYNKMVNSFEFTN